MCTAIKGAAPGTTVGTAITLQPSFGLSVSPADGSQAAVGTACTSDYVSIPVGIVSGIAATLSAAAIAGYNAEASSTTTRYCGRFFATVAGSASATTVATSVCSLAVPFELAVDFNDDEYCTANDSGKICEMYTDKAAATTGGGGILGFSLCYAQVDA
jgi:hypothetical protein